MGRPSTSRLAPQRFALVIGLVVMVVLLLELLIRASYHFRNSFLTVFPFFTIEYDHAPLPPWLTYTLVIQPDRTLFWRYRPNLKRSYLDIFGPVQDEEERTTALRRFIPAIPESLKERRVLEVSLNAEGFRDEPFPEERDPSIVRIVCLGDSWTFGWNVNQQEAYPQRLKALLKAEPGRRAEVFNLGVGGYTTYQGLELLKRRALDFRPDIIVIGFAMNDALLVGYRDKDVPQLRPGFSRRISRLLEISETFKLARYILLSAIGPAHSIASSLDERARTAGTPEEVWAGGAGLQRANFDALEPWTRVGLKDYETNIRQMIALARQHHADVILLYNQLWDTAYRKALEQVAITDGLPLINSHALISDARRAAAEQFEARLRLGSWRSMSATPEGQASVIFRVYAGERRVGRSLFIVGPSPQLGAMVPNKVAMYDDGSHGDQRAGDRVWSYSTNFGVGTRVFYTYTNSGDEGKWEGLDVPEVREFTVEANDSRRHSYRPIESFGKLYLQADSLHTDAEGYDLIARALLDILLKSHKLKNDLPRENSEPFTSRGVNREKGA